MLALNDAPQLIHVNAIVVAVLLSPLVPILVGAATKNHNRWRGAALIVLDALVAALVKARLPDGGAAFDAQTVIVWLSAVASSLFAYEHVLVPLGLTNNREKAEKKGPGKALLGPDTGL